MKEEDLPRSWAKKKLGMGKRKRGALKKQPYTLLI